MTAPIHMCDECFFVILASMQAGSRARLYNGTIVLSVWLWSNEGAGGKVREVGGNGRERTRERATLFGEAEKRDGFTLGSRWQWNSDSKNWFHFGLTKELTIETESCSFEEWYQNYFQRKLQLLIWLFLFKYPYVFWPLYACMWTAIADC